MPEPTRPHVALATFERIPDLSFGDSLLPQALAAHGIDAEPVVWSNPGADWRAFDAVVIRSCWDYHLHLEAFRQWLDHLEGLGVPVWNPPSLVRWNVDKRYLLDLARRGVATIPTMVVPRGNPGDVEEIARAEGWERFVVKPVVSASGYETHALRTPLGDDAREVIARVLSLSDVLVQPFAAEVGRDGEYSFTFLDGRFSHATLKRAAPGEFRVQAEHGGSDRPIQPSAHLVAQAERVLRALFDFPTPLYARVDGIERQQAFLLMELELIEPNLYLENSAGAAAAFAEGVARRLGRR